jgi:hypothetical protein
VTFGQAGVHDVADDHPHARGLDVALPDKVDAPPLGGGNRGDEFPAPGRGVEDALRRAHPLVHVPCYLLPDRLPGGLIDIPEPVRVKALVVDAGARRQCCGRLLRELVSHGDRRYPDLLGRSSFCPIASAESHSPSR